MSVPVKDELINDTIENMIDTDPLFQGRLVEKLENYEEFDQYDMGRKKLELKEKLLNYNTTPVKNENILKTDFKALKEFQEKINDRIREKGAHLSDKFREECYIEAVHNMLTDLKNSDQNPDYKQIQIAIGSEKEEKSVAYDEDEKFFKFKGKKLYEISKLIQTNKKEKEVYVVVLDSTSFGKYFIRISDLINNPPDFAEPENNLLCQYIGKYVGENLFKK